MTDALIIKDLGTQDYSSVWQAMQDYTLNRDKSAADQLWLVEHPPVFTQGQAGKAEHILNAGDIPIIQTDRGGQVTYHGPGQLVAYTLIDIKRKHFTIRQLVSAIEQAVIDCLAQYDIDAATRCKAPGVYTNDAKICSLGLRIKRGCSYHGLALNVAMDLSPFSRINPCGFEALAMTQIKDFVSSIKIDDVKLSLCTAIQNQLAYAKEGQTI